MMIANVPSDKPRLTPQQPLEQHQHPEQQVLLQEQQVLPVQLQLQQPR